MNRFASHLLRFALIAAGFIAGIASASIFMLALIWGGMMDGDPATEGMLKIAFSVSLPVTAAFVGYYAFAPAIVLAVLAEITARRSWLFHALGGMAVAIAALAMRAGDNFSSGILAVVLAAGAIGGTAYWLVAGRSAGRHLDELSTSASEGS